MRRLSLIVIFLIITWLGTSCGLPGSQSSPSTSPNNPAGNQSSSHYALNASSHCSWGTGQPITCTIVISNDKGSTGDFNWTVTSSVPGVMVSPSSGTVAPGASSDQIQATIPEGECPFDLRFANSTGTSVDVKETNC